MNVRSIIFAAWLLFASPAWAATPIIYSHGDISITPAPEPVETESKGDKIKEAAIVKEPVAPTPRTTHFFNVEIRPEKSFIQNTGMFTQPVLDEKHGMMVVVDDPGIVPVIGDNIYTAFDILFVNTHGRISQIAPAVNLSELSGEITPKEPVRAFIYLQAGLCKKFDIRPGDMVGHDIFHKNPVILN